MNKIYFMLHICQVKPPMTLNATRQFECCNTPNSKATLGRDNILNGICKDSPLSSQVLHLCTQLSKGVTMGCLVRSNQEVTFHVPFTPVLLVVSPDKASSAAVASSPDSLWPWHGRNASTKLSQTLWTMDCPQVLLLLAEAVPAHRSPWAPLSCGILGLPHTCVYSLVLLLFPWKTAGYFCVEGDCTDTHLHVLHCTQALFCWCRSRLYPYFSYPAASQNGCEPHVQGCYGLKNYCYQNMNIYL